MTDAFGVVGLVAVKRGISSLVELLTARPSVGEGAGEVVSELLASTARIEERLRSIENVLGVLVAQPYFAALGAGNRHLADAIQSATSSNRDREVQNARHRFVEAVSYARDPLQRAIAERGTALTSVALGDSGVIADAIERYSAAAGDAASAALRLTRLGDERTTAIRDAERRLSAGSMRWRMGIRRSTQKEARSQVDAMSEALVAASDNLIVDASDLQQQPAESRPKCLGPPHWGSGAPTVAGDLLIAPGVPTTWAGITVHPSHVDTSHQPWSATVAVRPSKYRSSALLEPCSFVIFEDQLGMAFEFDARSGTRFLDTCFRLTPGGVSSATSTANVMGSYRSHSLHPRRLPASARLRVGGLVFAWGFSQRQ